VPPNHGIADLTACAAVQVCALFERVINAEGSDVDLDQVAAAAMEAVEGAVRDEVEAATVLSATQAALAKTLQDLQALDGESAAARVAEISSALASTDMPAAAAASVDGSSVKAPSPTADAIQLLDSLTAAGAAAASGAPGGAAAAGSVLLQAVDASSSSNGSGAPAAATAAAAAPVAVAATAESASKAAEQAKKSQVDKAKAKLLKLGGAAVAVGLAYAFLQTAAGQVSELRLSAALCNISRKNSCLTAAEVMLSRGMRLKYTHSKRQCIAADLGQSVCSMMQHSSSCIVRQQVQTINLQRSQVTWVTLGYIGRCLSPTLIQHRPFHVPALRCSPW
jgi:hypothetical protein